MPSHDEAENVRSQIAQLESSRFVSNGDSLMPVFQGEPPEDAFFWSELEPDRKIEAMETWVTWDGFDREGQLDVIQNVIDGKEAAHWLDRVGDLVPSLSESDPASGYQVWFAHEARQPGEWPNEFPNDYWAAGRFDATSVEQADEKVVHHPERPIREDDIIIDPDGQAHILKGKGFEKVDLEMPPDEVSALSDRWSEMAGRVEPDRSYEQQLDELAQRSQPANDNREIER